MYEEESKALNWVLKKATIYVVIGAVLLFVLGFGLNALGLIGHTVVEREVFENSFQRQMSLQSSINQDLAVLAEIDAMLADPTISPGVRAGLNAQAAAARIRIATKRSEIK